MSASLEAWGVVFAVVGLLGRVVWGLGSWLAALAERVRLESKVLQAEVNVTAKREFH